MLALQKIVNTRKAIGDRLNNKEITNNMCTSSSLNTELNGLATTELPIAFNNYSFSNVTININNIQTILFEHNASV